jgi:hypothetical protein
MTQAVNRAKATLDLKVLRENPKIEAARKAWTAVILTHQSKYYQQTGQANHTAQSIQKKPANHFPVWVDWAPDAKQKYDALLESAGFKHGID